MRRPERKMDERDKDEGTANGSEVVRRRLKVKLERSRAPAYVEFGEPRGIDHVVTRTGLLLREGAVEHCRELSRRVHRGSAVLCIGGQG